MRHPGWGFNGAAVPPSLAASVVHHYTSQKQLSFVRRRCGDVAAVAHCATHASTGASKLHALTCAETGLMTLVQGIVRARGGKLVREILMTISSPE